jgi:hypothetical protein
MSDFCCDKCPRTFQIEDFYNKHQRVHELKKQHKCHTCDSVYGAARLLEEHVRTHLKEDVSRGTQGMMEGDGSAKRPSGKKLVDEEEDARYEPITETFFFEDQDIHPCYVVLPHLSDRDVETLCQRPISVS